VGKVFAIANQKGGVGKTTTAVNLSACLAEAGEKTLLIDLDPQGNATSGLGINRKELRQSIYDALLNRQPLSLLRIGTEIPQLDIIPSHRQLAGAEVELVEVSTRESRLKDVLRELRESYSFVLIDCPPSLGLLTVNGLTAADALIVPLQCEYYALEGISQLLEAVSLVRGNLNPSLGVAGILLTMADARTSLSGQVMEEVRKFFKDKVYKTVIPRNVRLSEAPGFGKPVLLYDAFSSGAEAYRQLAKEVMDSGQESLGEGAGISHPRG
jgi:chromosome partitioning protein